MTTSNPQSRVSQVLADIPRQDQSDNECPALPGYQYPDKTQQNNLMPSPYVPQERPQTLPRLPGTGDPEAPNSDAESDPAESIGTETMTIGTSQTTSSTSYPARLAIGDPCVLQFSSDGPQIPGEVVGIGFDASKVLYDVAVIVEEQEGPYYARPLQRVDSFFVSVPGEATNFSGPVEAKPLTIAAALLLADLSNQLLAPEGNQTVYPMDDTPEDDEQELNELYDASRADNNLGSPGSTTTGTPSLNQHASGDPDSVDPADDPDAPTGMDYPDMQDDPLADPSEEDMLLLGDSDGDTEAENPSDSGPSFSVDPAPAEEAGVDAGVEESDIANDGTAYIVPNMTPANGEGMRTPLGVDATTEAGILRDPYANKRNASEAVDASEDAADDEVDAALEAAEEGDDTQLLLDPDGTSWQTELGVDGTAEEDPYTYDTGDEEVSAEESEESEGAATGAHEDADASSASDITGLSSKEKNVLFDSLSAPGSGIGASASTGAERAYASATATPYVTSGAYVTLARPGNRPGGKNVSADDSEVDPQAERQQKVMRANARAWSILEKVVLKFTRGRALINPDDGTITFSTDVQFLAFVAALGMAHMRMRAYKPGQVVRKGRDTVHHAVLETGAVLEFLVDVRGFLDRVTLHA